VEVAGLSEDRGIGDLRRPALESKHKRKRLPGPPAYYIWQTAMLAFIVADVVALFSTGR
jgi:hypothetical protein